MSSDSPITTLSEDIKKTLSYERRFSLYTCGLMFLALYLTLSAPISHTEQYKNKPLLYLFRLAPFLCSMALAHFISKSSSLLSSPLLSSPPSSSPPSSSLSSPLPLEAHEELKTNLISSIFFMTLCEALSLYQNDNPRQHFLMGIAILQLLASLFFSKALIIGIESKKILLLSLLSLLPVLSILALLFSLFRSSPLLSFPNPDYSALVVLLLSSLAPIGISFTRLLSSSPSLSGVTKWSGLMTALLILVVTLLKASWILLQQDKKFVNYVLKYFSLEKKHILALLQFASQSSALGVANVANARQRRGWKDLICINESKSEDKKNQ